MNKFQDLYDKKFSIKEYRIKEKPKPNITAGKKKSSDIKISYKNDQWNSL